MIRTFAVLSAILAASPALADCAGLLKRDAAAAASLFAPDTAICPTAQQTTGEALFCYSEHPFRSETALIRAEQLETELSACFAAVPTIADVTVNHPDSYDVRHFNVQGARISLSVKDKGALGKTLIFLRIVETEGN